MEDNEYKYPGPLDPAPAVVHAEGEYPGKLSPNPHMSPDIKENEGQSTPVEENQAPKQSIQKFGNVLVDTLRSLGKIKVHAAEDLIDENGNPIIHSEGGGSDVKAYKGDYIGSETAFTPEMKVGDVIINDSGFVGVIKAISFNNDTCSAVTISGIENNNKPTTYVYNGSTWTHTELSLPKMELIASLGTLYYGAEGGTPESWYGKDNFVLPDYDLYIITFNNTFIITPLSQPHSSGSGRTDREALTCCSAVYNDSGESMIARGRVLARVAHTDPDDSNFFRIKFDDAYAKAVYDYQLTPPTAYLFGVKL